MPFFPGLVVVLLAVPPALAQPNSGDVVVRGCLADNRLEGRQGLDQGLLLTALHPRRQTFDSPAWLEENQRFSLIGNPRLLNELARYAGEEIEVTGSKSTSPTQTGLTGPEYIGGAAADLPPGYVGPQPTQVPAWPDYDVNPFVFDLNFKVPSTARGAIFVHELDGDGLMDFIVTGIDAISIYDHWGKLLWSETPPINLPEQANGSGYPGRHGPGAIAGDVDGDGQAEVAYITRSGRLRIRDGKTGRLENGAEEAQFTYPGGEAIVIANFRGLGDQDAIVQYSQSELRAISLEDGHTLWHTTTWAGLDHSSVRVADLDGDGIDEVIGPNILDAKGQQINTWNLKKDRGTSLGGLDSLAVADIVPGGPLEIALAETAPDKSGVGIQTGETLLVNPLKVVWGTLRPSQDIPPTGECSREKDPDKLAVGDFDLASPGLEVFARSACGRHPWVMNAQGKIIAKWNVSATAPSGWYLGGDPLPNSDGGIDVVTPIHWEGNGRRLILVKERHLDRTAAIVDPLNGKFIKHFNVKAARTYVADISGDHREEVVVVQASNSGNGSVKIFWNAEPSTGLQPREWRLAHYRRVKQNWNYYSP